MALEPRRVERWLRDAYPTQEVHDRVEWHAEGSMTQCFVRLDDRVVLIHLVGEGDRTVLKGRLENPARSLEAGIHASHTFATRRHPIPPPYQRGHLQQPRRSSARIRTQLGGALAHRNACRHDATTHPDPATFRIACKPHPSRKATRDGQLGTCKEGAARDQRHPRTVRG